MPKNNWEFTSIGKITYCSAQPSRGAWSVIDSSVMEVSPRYYFSLSSYHTFCKSCFCYPSQIWTFKNGCEKWTEKCDKIWLKISAVETLKLMHNAYTDEEQLGDSTFFHWHKTFFKGRDIVALLPHIGRPLSICTEEMVNAIATVVREDRHIIVRQLAQALDTSKSSFHMILREKLKMWRITACWVPHFLTSEQRVHCIDICCECLKIILK